MHKDFARLGHDANRNQRRQRKNKPAKSFRLSFAWLRPLSFKPMLLLSLLLGLLFLSLLDQPLPTSQEHVEWLPVVSLHAASGFTQRHVRIRSGEVAAQALQRLGLSAAQSFQLVQASKKVQSLARIRAGAELWLRRDGDAWRVSYPMNSGEVLLLSSADGVQWKAKKQRRVLQTEHHLVHAVIEDSLFAAGQKAGLANRALMNMVDVFSWDIDFARDLRRGDRFSVWLEDSFDEQGKHLSSTILAAEFVNQGHVYQAFRFKSKHGLSYFSANGKSMRKAYLKAPVKFSRISSRFRLQRKHPVLGYTRAHRGVDYAARSGTPIHAVGDGRVTQKRWRGGYGRYIEIQHVNRNHSTAYAHMSAYAHGIHVGSKVTQGQVIGYVGMTGLATGPHLHFEFRVRGRAVNPLTIKRIAAKPVARAERADFQAIVRQRLKMLKQEEESWG